MPSSTLRNLAFVVLVVAGLGVVGQGWDTEKEVFRNLGGGVAAWIVCGLLLVVGLVILWGAVTRSAARVTGRGGPEPSRRGELVAMFVVVILAGVIGASFGRNLDWRLDWAAGKYLEGRAVDWPEVQAWVGWALAVSVVVSVWAIAAQVLADRRK